MQRSHQVWLAASGAAAERGRIRAEILRLRGIYQDALAVQGAAGNVRKEAIAGGYIDCCDLMLAYLDDPVTADSATGT